MRRRVEDHFSWRGSRVVILQATYVCGPSFFPSYIEHRRLESIVRTIRSKASSSEEESYRKVKFGVCDAISHETHSLQLTL